MVWRTTNTGKIELLCGFQVAIETVRIEGDWASVVHVPDSCDAAVRHATATRRAIGVHKKLCITVVVDFAGDKGVGGQRERNAHIDKGGENVCCCLHGWYYTGAVQRFSLR